jgi:hypothetical protein
VNSGFQTLVKTRVRSGQKKWLKIVILTILSPVRLPFRHTGFGWKTLVVNSGKGKRELL